MTYLGELISLGTAFCWTITVVSFEYAGKRVGSLPVNFIRLVFGFVLLAITLYLIDGTFIPLYATNTEWLLLTISSLIGLVIGDFFLFQAFVDIGGRISLLIMSSVPILSIIFGYIFFNEVLSIQQFIGITIVIISIVVVILSRKDEGNKIQPHIARGIIFAFVGAIAQAIGLLFSKAGGANMNDFAATEIRVIAAIIGFGLIVSFKKEWKNVRKAFNYKTALLFIILGSIFGPFLGITSSLAAIKYTSLGISTTIAQMNIILIIPFSIFLFKEKVTLLEIIGSISAFIGVAILFINFESVLSSLSNIF